jgi:DNA-binding CsgD family transcriptional regulator
MMTLVDSSGGREVGWADGRRLWFVGVTATLLALMLAEQLYLGDEPFDLFSLVLEIVESGLIVGCSVASAMLVLRARAQEEDTRLLRQEVAADRADAQRWRQDMGEHLRQLGEAIRRQFEAWGLTAAEQEIGFLLLKGLSHKEIARLRSTSEATIRQQAASIYQKARLGGRAALSAFFLEDLLDNGAAQEAPAQLGRRAAS